MFVIDEVVSSAHCLDCLLLLFNVTGRDGEWVEKILRSELYC